MFEILSDTTESYDRAAKFEQYQKLPPVREYVLVSQTKVRVERFVRQPDETWLLTIFDDPAGEFALTTVAVRVPLADIYRGGGTAAGAEPRAPADTIVVDRTACQMRAPPTTPPLPH